MFAHLQNHVEIAFELRPEGPILIRAQDVGIDPSVASIEFHRTVRGGEPTVFLAGSGLKGVIRAHVERILRTAGLFACDPTKTKESAYCGYHSRELVLKAQSGPSSEANGDSGKATPADPERPHAGQCPACYTFGSLKLAGRFRAADAYPSTASSAPPITTEVRAGVGIDRKSQGPSTGALYDTEVVVDGAFDVKIQGENFSLWQVGIILLALSDLNAGMVQIGGGKSRGMGTVTVHNERLSFRFLNGPSEMLVGAEERGSFDYQLPEDDILLIEGIEDVEDRGRGLYRQIVFPTGAVPNLRQQLIEHALMPYLQPERA